MGTCSTSKVAQAGRCGALLPAVSKLRKGLGLNAAPRLQVFRHELPRCYPAVAVRLKGELGKRGEVSEEEQFGLTPLAQVRLISGANQPMASPA